MIDYKQYLAETKEYPLNAPHTHIGKRYKDMLKFKKDAVPGKAILKALKDMSWEELSFAVHGEQYHVILPEHVRAMLTDYYKDPAKYKDLEFGEWALVTGMTETGAHGGYDSFGPAIFVYEGKLNSAQFYPNALASKVRGIGVGSKIIRALLHKCGHLSADLNAPAEVKRLWINLAKNKLHDDGTAKDEHVNSIAVGDNLFVLDPATPTDEKLRLTGVFIQRTKPTVKLKGKDFDVDPVLRDELEHASKGIFADLDATQQDGYAPAPAPYVPAAVNPPSASATVTSHAYNVLKADHPTALSPGGSSTMEVMRNLMTADGARLYVDDAAFTSPNDSFCLYVVKETSLFYVYNARDFSDVHTMTAQDFEAWSFDLTRVRLKEVTNKSELKKGDRVAVVNHKTYFGLACRVDRTKLGANDRQSVYVNVKPGTLAIEMRPKNIHKMVKYNANESSTILSFKDFVREDVDFDMLDNTRFADTNTNMQEFNRFERSRSAVVKAFTEMAWADVKFTDEGDTRYVLLPQAVRNEIGKFGSMWNGKKKPDEPNVKIANFFGKWKGVSGHDGSDCVKFRIDENRRTHFPNELSNNIRNIGVGVKLYRAVLHHEKYITSFSNATIQAQRAWASMVAPHLDASHKPTADHVYAMSLGDTVLAIDPSVTGEECVEILKWFTTKRVKNFEVTALNVGIDPVLKHAADEIDPTVLAPYDTEGIKQAALDKAAKEKADAEEKAAAAKAEAEAKAVLAKAAQEAAEAQLKITLQNRIHTFCATDENDHSWDVGDYVIVRAYLLMEHKNLPIRRVIKKDGNMYVAVKNTNYKAFLENGEVVDPRQTATKEEWVKAVVPKPGTNLPPVVMHNTGKQPDPTKIVADAPAVSPAPAAAPAVPAAAPGSLDAFMTCNGVQAGLVEGVNAHEMKKRQRLADDAMYLLVQNAALTDHYTSYPVFAVEVKNDTYHVTNLRTGEKVTMAGEYVKWYDKYTMMEIETEAIKKKTEVGKNSKVLVYNHRTYFGIVASVDRVKLGKDDRQQIYVRCKKTGLAIEMRPNNLHKVK